MEPGTPGHKSVAFYNLVTSSFEFLWRVLLSIGLIILAILISS